MDWSDAVIQGWTAGANMAQRRNENAENKRRWDTQNEREQKRFDREEKEAQAREDAKRAKELLAQATAAYQGGNKKEALNKIKELHKMHKDGNDIKKITHKGDVGKETWLRMTDGDDTVEAVMVVNTADGEFQYLPIKSQDYPQMLRQASALTDTQYFLDQQKRIDNFNAEATEQTLVDNSGKTITAKPFMTPDGKKKWIVDGKQVDSPPKGFMSTVAAKDIASIKSSEASARQKDAAASYYNAKASGKGSAGGAPVRNYEGEIYQKQLVKDMSEIENLLRTGTKTVGYGQVVPFSEEDINQLKSSLAEKKKEYEELRGGGAKPKSTTQSFINESINKWRQQQANKQEKPMQQAAVESPVVESNKPEGVEAADSMQNKRPVVQPPRQPEYVDRWMQGRPQRIQPQQEDGGPTIEGVKIDESGTVWGNVDGTPARIAVRPERKIRDKTGAIVNNPKYDEYMGKLKQLGLYRGNRGEFE